MSDPTTRTKSKPEFSYRIRSKEAFGLTQMQRPGGVARNISQEQPLIFQKGMIVSPVGGAAQGAKLRSPKLGDQPPGIRSTYFQFSQLLKAAKTLQPECE
ncbi:hypothetical protein TWF569_002034 [Orbilia oligospora]|uniref:Uncharacterized protein n=1 Tax=Orbilia oligospora TaxID=2813651 RepID=A0A7C8IZL9_ORBOL|nr:hypothetical protein TWF102_002966 [Orbilia oligospora]KAF3081229.1 hypothetical protein TWF706_002342 [Orbilia oligospora]KAF3117358.1 hypothetical protein TWF103_007496 [Orbilia oligospora]KAF3120107.1 hypothetical protein TWF703_002752 [Orbilia oligospora]KAF3122886.1 hypothetical protein TWF569_002034 [Orbilia oligospora]